MKPRSTLSLDPLKSKEGKNFRSRNFKDQILKENLPKKWKGQHRLKQRDLGRWTGHILPEGQVSLGIEPDTL